MNAHEELVAAEIRPQVPSTLLSGLRVFVAEDEPILLWALEDVLSGMGCTVVGTAARVADSLAFVANTSFDVAVLDGSLADGDIDPVVDMLVARGTPFVLASGFASTRFSASFRTAVFLRKPYTDANLGQAMLRAIGK